ncbi:DNA damage-inducible protein 1 [Portunus trituberculatus]|uniref:DNA damage-inducible protein 1 n=1 Tax=Portunus trituberculatus TaxID=210409 RepID=A0A5B7DLR4_PORTR|nr:DNA damage-inducible protein 1 [Portunus trituberculatus]
MGMSGHGYGLLDVRALLIVIKEKMNRYAQETLREETSLYIDGRCEEVAAIKKRKPPEFNGRVDGKPCRLLVDAGAEQTFAGSDCVDATGLQIAEQRLRGVTSHCLSLKGPVQASIGVGSKEKLPVFVANTELACPLEMDHLRQHEVNLDLGRQTLRVQGEEVPLFPSGNAEQAFCVELRCVTAPAVKGKLHQSMGRRSESDTTPIVPGKARPASKMEGRGRAEAGRISGEVLPQLFEDLACQSTDKLTENQTKAMQRPLCQYVDVFSPGELDIGRSSRWPTGSSGSLMCDTPERRTALQFGCKMLISGKTMGRLVLKVEACVTKGDVSERRMPKGGARA